MPHARVNRQSGEGRIPHRRGILPANRRRTAENPRETQRNGRYTPCSIPCMSLTYAAPQEQLSEPALHEQRPDAELQYDAREALRTRFDVPRGVGLTVRDGTIT